MALLAPYMGATAESIMHNQSRDPKTCWNFLKKNVLLFSIDLFAKYVYQNNIFWRYIYLKDHLDIRMPVTTWQQRVKNQNFESADNINTFHIIIILSSEPPLPIL